MKLSIITINYNDAAGLRKTIESVVAQTSPDFEYLVIDGGSTDGSEAVIEEFKSRIDCWISEPDRGIYHAMNKGIARATGTYCQFLNSGDVLASVDVTEKMLFDLPDTEIIYGNMLKYLPGGKLYRDRGPNLKEVTMLTFYRSTLNHSSAYIKRSLFDKYGLYDEKLRIVSDWKWYMIVVGFNNELISYKDIDVSVFDLNGISNANMALNKKERTLVLAELMPANILADYDAHARSIKQIQRVKRYPLTRFLFNCIDRIISKLEKLLGKTNQ